MRISRNYLKKIVKEEAAAVLYNGDDIKNDLFDPLDNMISLGKGIAEEEKSEKKKPKCSGTPGNPYHSKSTGQWTSYKDSDYCYSKYFSCPSGGRTRGKKGSKQQLAISDPQNAGRGPRKDTHGDWKCSTNKKIEEDQIGEGRDERIEIYLRSVISDEIRKALKDLRKGDGDGCSFADVLSVVRQFEAAKKAKVGKVQKG